MTTDSASTRKTRQTGTQGHRKRSNGEGTLVRRADGLWAAALVLTTRDGQRKRKYVYARTQRECREKLAEVRRQAEAGVVPDGRTVGALLRSWLDDTLPGTVKLSTEANYRHIVERHLLLGLGDVRLDRLKPAQIRAFLRSKGEEVSPSTGRPLSARTVQLCHAVLRTALESARRDELVPRNVASLVQPPRPRREEVQPLDVADARRLLDAARSDRLGALYTVALAVGLRKGEALALRWSLVDLDAGTLRVAGTLQRLQVRSSTRRTELVVVEPKTARSRRTVPLPFVCLDALREHRRRQAAERLAAPVWVDPDLVFTTEVGTPLDPRNVTRLWQDMVGRLDLGRRVRFHDLRHTCASLLLAQGVEPRVVMETLGHSVIGTTLNIYGHVLPVVQRAAAAQMHDALTGPSG